MMKIEEIKTFVWGSVVGAVVLFVVLLSTDWMVSASASETVARESANQAMVDSLAPICVTQFHADATTDTLRAELEKTNSWDRPQYIQKHGWSTMPGAEKPAERDVAVECARLILG